MADTKEALGSGYDVVAIIRGSLHDGSRIDHAVGVIQIDQGKVIYGDPWSGFFWITDECSFDAALEQGSTVFVKW